MSNTINMADFIAERRKAKGMTQKQLAEKLNITDKAISKWERGQGYPDITILEPLAALLNVSVAELLKGALTEVPAENANEVQQTLPAKVAEDQVVQKTLQYADNIIKEKSHNTKDLWRFITTLVFAASIISCSVVDVAINKTITWAIIPIASIVFTWLVLVPVFNCHRLQKLPLALLVLNVLVFPLLGQCVKFCVKSKDRI